MKTYGECGRDPQPLMCLPPSRYFWHEAHHVVRRSTVPAAHSPERRLVTQCGGVQPICCSRHMAGNCRCVAAALPRGADDHENERFARPPPPPHTERTPGVKRGLLRRRYSGLRIGSACFCPLSDADACTVRFIDDVPPRALCAAAGRPQGV